MRNVSKTVYLFSELSDSAKERARDWLRELTFSDSGDWSRVYDDADTIAAMIGIDINRRQYKTMGGGTGSEPAIFFSGFSSQGDGACFEGDYHYRKGSVKAVKAHAPQDVELHRIATTLQELQAKHSYRLTASMVQRGHYSHSGCMQVEVEKTDYECGDTSAFEGDLVQLMRDFADWIYSQLRSEYEYQISDEVIDESMAANEYEFNEDGSK